MGAAWKMPLTFSCASSFERSWIALVKAMNCDQPSSRRTLMLASSWFDRFCTSTVTICPAAFSLAPSSKMPGVNSRRDSRCEERREQQA